MSTIEERVMLASTMLDADDSYIIIGVRGGTCWTTAAGQEHTMYAMLASFITESGLDIDRLRGGIKWFERGARLEEIGGD